MYARTRHNVTIHIARDATTVLCGHRPRYSEWTGQDTWEPFTVDLPASEGAWETTPPTDLLCKRCAKLSTAATGDTARAGE